MNSNRRFKLMLMFLNEVQDMHDELLDLRREVEELREYKKKYEKLLDSTIANSQVTVGNMLSLLMTPGLTEVLKNNRDVF